MLSMTGYGVGAAPLSGADGAPDGQVVVEVRAVNHRFLDLRVRGLGEVAELVGPAEDVLRQALVRGRIEAQVRVERPSGPAGAVALDVERARAAFAALAALRDELAPGDPVPLSLLASVPDLFAATRPPLGEAAQDAVAHAAREAAQALVAMRRREGAALRRDLADRLARIEGWVAELEAQAPHAVAAWRERLRDRVGRLLDGASVALDAARLEQEVAFHAERSDVAEELTRLASHCAQFRAALDADDEAVGRRLDFLLQEMNREANTIGAKSTDLALSHRVVDLKAELERLREQVQNVL